MHSSPPNLESFEQVLEDLARDPRIAPHSPEWIQDSVVAGGEKVRILQYILEAHPPGGSPPRVLDIGAQIGSFALLAAKHGCRISALDYAFYADIYAKITAGHGVDYRACDLASEPLPYKDCSFDFVTYTDVIEHHAFSPRPVLREIYRVLAPGGRVIILTPNQASIYNRLTLLFGGSIYGDFDHFFDTGADGSIYLGHHHEFTRAELSAALERTGFKVRESRAIEEDLASLLYFRRRYPERVVSAHRRFLLVRAMGPVWSFFHLNFGRVLWAVGEKPRVQNP
ncbi:MAG: class I SAM-dependent methyltransferase [Candidatus Acidiferrales bacterium]